MGRRPFGRILVPVMAVTMGLALVGGGAWWHHSQAATALIRQDQQLMGLTALDSPVKAAPDFHLTDQNGQEVSLASLRGKVVVLEFMDPVCTDICPIVSQEIRRADELLGTSASHVSFLAINVNQYHESLHAVMSFSKEQGLNRLSNWHFLTGDTAQLAEVWKAYGVQVVPNPTGDVQHSSVMYFIDAKGAERYVANPSNDSALILAWAKGIRDVVRQVL